MSSGDSTETVSTILADFFADFGLARVVLMCRPREFGGRK
jgi:hypothetical protein